MVSKKNAKKRDGCLFSRGTSGGAASLFAFPIKTMSAKKNIVAVAVLISAWNLRVEEASLFLWGEPFGDQWPNSSNALEILVHVEKETF
jgi:hypothetical protein